MKRLNALFAGIAILMPFQFLSAQKTGAILQDNPSPISVIGSEKLSSFSLQRNIALDLATFKRDGDEIGKQNSYGFNLDYNYYPKGKWGFGTTIFLNQTTNDFNTTKTTNTDFGAFANISLIEVLNPQTAIYGRVGVGYISDILKVTSGSNSDKQSNDGFAIRGTVGLPVHLDKFAYVTPFVQYQYQSGSVEDGKFTDSRFGAGVNLEGYLRCHEDYKCDSKNDYKFSKNAYDPGSNMFGFWTTADFSSGTINTKYDDGDETKDKYSNVNISVDYTRYWWDGIGIGMELRVKNDVQESKDFDFKLSSTTLDVSPKIVFQGPFDGGARNLFLEAKGTFGSQTFKTTSGSNSNTIKDNVSGFGLGFGYNCFFSENLALTPIIGYDWATLKDDESGEKQKRNTFRLGLGVRANF